MSSILIRSRTRHCTWASPRRIKCPSIYDVLMQRVPLETACREVRPGLTVVPSHIDLAAVEIELAGEVGREVVLRDRLQAAELTDDFLVIDCPPVPGHFDVERARSGERGPASRCSRTSWHCTA